MKFFQLTGRTLKVFVVLLVIALLLGTLLLGANHYVKSYNIFEAEKVTATVTEKTAEKGLFRPPAHYVKVDINDNTEDVYEGLLNRVTSRQMNTLEIGDDISGYLISNQHFITIYDMMTDGVLVLLTLSVIAIIIVGFIGVFMISRSRKENSEKNHNKSRHKQTKAQKKKNRAKKRKAAERKNHISIGFLFLIVFFTVAGIFSISALVNGAQKIIPMGKTVTEAEIMEKHSEREWLFEPIFINQTDDPVYQFKLRYSDETGTEHIVIKEITPHTYDKYEVFDTIAISYRNNNPFNIFIEDSNWIDLFEITLYWEFYIYTSVIVLALVFIIIRIRDYLK